MDRRRSSHIIPEIYEATINPAHWDYVVNMIAKLTRSKSACLYYRNKEMEFASTIAQFGLDETDSPEVGTQCDLLDELFAATRSDDPDRPKFEQFEPAADGTIRPESDLFENWMQPNGIFHVGGAMFVNTETHQAGLAILRDQKAGAWEEGEIRVMDEILPHLRRALNIHSEFTYLRLRQDALLKGLDRLVIGLILYDRQAKPVYINPTARAIIEAHPALTLVDGDLLLTSPEEDRKLRQTIIDAAEIDIDDSWKQSVAIGITHPDSQMPLPLLVTPMHAHMITSDLDYEGAKVALFMSDPDLQQPISVDSLVSVYNLTPSEAQVAIRLANGHSIDEIANSSNHSSHTIRSQLKAVFRKTGVSRQSELIKLLLTGPFAQRRRGSNAN